METQNFAKGYERLPVDGFANLVLEKPRIVDFAFIKGILTDPAMMEAQGGVWEEEQLNYFLQFLGEHWKAHGFGHYVLKEGLRPIGLISLKKMIVGKKESFDIGFSVIKSDQKRGYATAAARTLINLAFQKLGVKELSALTLENQEAGVTVLKKLGFQWVGASSTEYAGREWKVIQWTLRHS